MQDISCIKDLTLLYEAATIEDIYLAYQYLKVDDASLFSCVGVAGAQAVDDLSGKMCGHSSILDMAFFFY